MSDVPLEVAAGCAEWPVEWPCDTTGVDAAKLDAAKEVAVTLLWSYGGRSVGECTWVQGYYPPCRECPGGPYKTLSGAWRNGTGVRDCCALRLERSPAVAVSVVTVFGNLLDDTGYVLDGQVLRRVGDCWPCGIGCDWPPVVVTYLAGFPFPAITPFAVGEVACEALRGLNGETCRLPTSAISITRQGVTVQLADPAETAKRRRLGLPIADAWLEAVNPHSLAAPSRVYSPDLPRRGR